MYATRHAKDNPMKFTLSKDDFDDIIEVAGYGIEWCSRMASTDKGCHFTDDEGKKYFVTRKMLETAARDLHTRPTLNSEYQKAIRLLVTEGNAGEVDGGVASALVQQACFGEVIYG